MKKLKVEGKLNISKERISILNDSEMGSVQGGRGAKYSNDLRCTQRVNCVPNTQKF